MPFLKAQTEHHRHSFPVIKSCNKTAFLTSNICIRINLWWITLVFLFNLTLFGTHGKRKDFLLRVRKGNRRCISYFILLVVGALTVVIICILFIKISKCIFTPSVYTHAQKKIELRNTIKYTQQPVVNLGYWLDLQCCTEYSRSEVTN